MAKSGSTTTDNLNEAIDEVRRAGGGVVLNGMNMKSVKYSYKSKYGKYGYKYKYQYRDSYET